MRKAYKSLKNIDANNSNNSNEENTWNSVGVAFTIAQGIIRGWYNLQKNDINLQIGWTLFATKLTFKNLTHHFNVSNILFWHFSNKLGLQGPFISLYPVPHIPPPPPKPLLQLQNYGESLSLVFSLPSFLCFTATQTNGLITQMGLKYFWLLQTESANQPHLPSVTPGIKWTLVEPSSYFCCRKGFINWSLAIWVKLLVLVVLGKTSDWKSYSSVKI